MKTECGADPRQLLTLERLRSVELETAQTQHAKLEQVTLEKRSVVVRVEADITATQSFVRDQLAGAQPISLDALQRCTQFSAVQAVELAAAQKALEASRAESDAAHASVVEHFERLSVVEKLRERRAVEASKDVLRTSQKRLDEHALSKMTGGTAAKREE